MLISEIATEIITEIGGDTSDTDLASKVVGFIKSALRRFPLHARDRFLTASKTATLNSGAYSVTLPDGMLDEMDVYYPSDTGVRENIDFKERGEFNRLFSPTGSGAPAFYSVIGSTVEFDKPADKAYTITFDCKQPVSNITAASTFTGADDVVEVLKDGAKMYYYSYVEDPQNKADSLVMFRSGLDALDAKYSRNNLGTHIEEA